MSSFAVQADLENALGGATVLLQLSDPNKTGQIQQPLVFDYLEDGAAQVRAAAEIKHDPEVLANLDTPSLKRLVDANAALSARTAYEKGGLGMAMPEWIRDRAERADKFCDDLAHGLRRLGRVAGGAVAAINQPTGTVDYDPNGDGGNNSDGSPAARISMTGLKLGFR